MRGSSGVSREEEDELLVEEELLLHNPHRQLKLLEAREHTVGELTIPSSPPGPASTPSAVSSSLPLSPRKTRERTRAGWTRRVGGGRRGRTFSSLSFAVEWVGEGEG